MGTRDCIKLWLNIASLLLGLAGAALAAYPAFFPYHGEQSITLPTLGAPTVVKSAAFEAWRARAESFSRWGLILVAIGTAVAAAAQIIDWRKD